MSADRGYTLNADALMAEAAKLEACGAFRVETGGSRHHCADCDASLVAHMVVVLRATAAQTCGTCAHSDDDASIFPSLNTYCTKRIGWFNGKLMPKTARCDGWKAAPRCRECKDTVKIEVTYNSDPTTSRTIFCDQCEAGRDANRDALAREDAADGR
jgi:hypothetical protein